MQGVKELPTGWIGLRVVSVRVVLGLFDVAQGSLCGRLASGACRNSQGGGIKGAKVQNYRALHCTNCVVQDGPVVTAVELMLVLALLYCSSADCACCCGY